jgi:hypothetical protein
MVVGSLDQFAVKIPSMDPLHLFSNQLVPLLFVKVLPQTGFRATI